MPSTNLRFEYGSFSFDWDLWEKAQQSQFRIEFPDRFEDSPADMLSFLSDDFFQQWIFEERLRELVKICSAIVGNTEGIDWEYFCKELSEENETEDENDTYQ